MPHPCQQETRTESSNALLVAQYWFSFLEETVKFGESKQYCQFMRTSITTHLMLKTGTVGRICKVLRRNFGKYLKYLISQNQIKSLYSLEAQFSSCKYRRKSHG